jgi:para-nitrobenzyl esterase
MNHLYRYSLLATSFAAGLLSACGDSGKPAAPDAAPPVDVNQVMTTAGPVKGSSTADMRSFKGIPYAKPPVGALRWKPPAAPDTFTAVRDATKLAPHCPQNDTPFGAASKSEDCLYLNVYTPTTAGPHPVMFWMHGGALFLGQSDEYDATRLVAQGITVVTINYRLGMLGFMSHPSLTAESTAATKSSGNYGLMDQQAALKWVQANIGAFGGDRTNVTIFGESAGGLSVHSQLASPGAAGLFHKAIVQSGAYSNLRMPSLAIAETTGTTLSTLAGCAAPCSADNLRALTVDQILAAQTASGISTWIPSIDLNVIPALIGTTLAAGTYNKVPIIQGSNHDEYRLFVGLNELTTGGPLANTEVAYTTAVRGVFGPAGPDATHPSLSDSLLATHPFASYDSASLAFAAVGTDGIFACNSRIAAKTLSTTTSTWVYEFSDPNAPQLFLPPATGFSSYGAYHASELQYLWVLPKTKGGAAVTLSADQQALTNTMVKYWTNFAKTGNPNSADLPNWPKYATTGDGADSILSLGTGAGNVKVTTTFAADHKCLP